MPSRRLAHSTIYMVVDGQCGHGRHARCPSWCDETEIQLSSGNFYIHDATLCGGSAHVKEPSWAKWR